MKNKKLLSKKEIDLIFRELKIKKDKTQSNFTRINKKEIGKKIDDVWILSDSTSLFNNFNNKIYGKLESNIG